MLADVNPDATKKDIAQPVHVFQMKAIVI